MHLNYHAWKNYIECPRKFFLSNIKKAPSTIESNDYFKIYGLSVEKFFEMFCNHWRYETPYMPIDLIKHNLRPIFNAVIENSIIKWGAPGCVLSQEEIFNQAVDGVFTIMETENQNYFLNTKAEVSFSLNLKDNHKMTGRVDFIHSDILNKDITIIDGKGSMTMGRHVDKRQLFFYALLYFFSFKKLPTQMGFFYYRFNTFVDIDINIEVLKKFRAIISSDFKKMCSGKVHSPTPFAKSCKYCIYINECEAGLKAKSKRSRKSRLNINGEGLVTFGF